MQPAKSRCVLIVAVCLTLGGMSYGVSLVAQEQPAPKADLARISHRLCIELGE